MMILTLLLIIVFVIILYRFFRMRGDGIVNSDQEPFLTDAECMRRRGQKLFDAWITQDEKLLTLMTQKFPQVTLPDPQHLCPPNLQSVKFKWLAKAIEAEHTYSWLAVGGPPAAMMAFQQAASGQNVLYASNVDMQSGQKTARPIWAGAANHGEPDALTMAPAFISGQHPLQFLWKSLLRALNPPRFKKEVLNFDYPWLTLNIIGWCKGWRQIPAGLRVAWGNYCLAHFHKKKKNGALRQALYESIQNRSHRSGEYLEQFNHRYGKILREPRGSLIVAPDQATWEVLLADQKILQSEGLELAIIGQQEAAEKYGFVPRNSYGLMEKVHDFIFMPNFMSTIDHCITHNQGVVKKNWHLTTIHLQKDKQGGIAEFYEPDLQRHHAVQFTNAHLSLGPTLYQPNYYDLVSVTGVSIHAFVFGVALKGGPFVCGGKGNHIAVVPLTEPQMVHGEPVSLIRIAAGGSVGPRNRGPNDWYRYEGSAAINALHCVRETLPQQARLKILSVIGCNRLIGKDGRQVEIHPYLYDKANPVYYNNICLQVGAAGGGLSQMGAVAKTWAGDS